jgi:protein TonB
VIAAHVAVIYAVAVSLGVVEAPPIVEPLMTVFIETPPPVAEPILPEQPPDLAQPQVDVPAPETPQIAPSPETSPVIIPVVADANPPSTPSSPTMVVESTSLTVTRRVDPVYPPASRRMDEHGVVRLRVLVDERGRPREVQVAQSSGFERLDEAAITAVRRWQFSPAMQESRAISAWTQVKVIFQLNR